jgi:hypothetical protein
MIFPKVVVSPGDVLAFHTTGHDPIHYPMPRTALRIGDRLTDAKKQIILDSYQKGVTPSKIACQLGRPSGVIRAFIQKSKSPE